MLSDRKIIYVDAENANIISIQTLVFRDDALVFPPGTFRPGAKPQKTEITVNESRNGGKGIVGPVFRSYNSCAYYKCVDNSTNGACDENASQCLDYSVVEKGKEGQDFHSVNSWFTMDAKFIDPDRDWAADGYPDGRLTVVWKEAPVFGPRIQKPGDGVWGSDTDFNKLSVTDPEDSFTELQVYYLLNYHHRFMSRLLNDGSENGVCLIGSGPNCTAIDPKSNMTADKWNSPFRFTVNLLAMKEPGRGDGLPDLFEQLRLGYGKDAAKPITFKGGKSYDEAFFSGSNAQPTDDQRNCSSYDMIRITQIKPRACQSMKRRFPLLRSVRAQNQTAR
jgi:hypothetical protein